MSVRLSADEAWAHLESAHTGIFTTLRADGFPVTLPVWFMVLDHTVCLGAPSATKKIARVRRDPRASFLVESGAAWSELKAVQLTGEVEIVTEPDVTERIASLLDEKYAAFRTSTEQMPSATASHYAGRTFLRLWPHQRILSWDNSRIELGPK